VPVVRRAIEPISEKPQRFVTHSNSPAGLRNPSGDRIWGYRHYVTTSLEHGVLSEELITIMAALRRLIQRRLRTTMSGPPLRGAHLELLELIQKQPGIGIAPAGRALHLAANSVSTLVNQLIDMGMLVRQTSPDDRRAARLWLTETAKQRLAACRQARVELIERTVAGLSSAERRALAQALPALRSLLGALDAADPDKAPDPTTRPAPAASSSAR
jgi:DNA-binding MarR family transcriptional regulator